MRKMIFPFLYLLLIFMWPDSSAHGQSALRYGPDVVALTGRLEVVEFPGRPNYESIEAGDEVDRVLVLFLDHPVDVIGSPVPPGVDPEGWPDTESHTDITSIHVVRPPEDPPGRWDDKAPVRVRVEGSLMDAHSAHHKTEVVLFSREIVESD